MKLREILARKGTEVVTVSPDGTVRTAMKVLVRHDIGSVVVMREEEVVGILTERDILRLAARNPSRLDTTPVEDAMSTDLVIALPSDDLAYAMEVMTENRVRHLPILEEGRLYGIVSIGDLVNASRKEVEAENRYLRDYIYRVRG